MIGRPVHSVLPSDWLDPSVLLSRPCPCMPLDKTYPTGGTLRVFRHFAWLQAGSVKTALSRPAHQRVTLTVGRRNKMHEIRSQGMKSGSSCHALHAPLDVK
jgi:hypothetical protein